MTCYPSAKHTVLQEATRPMLECAACGKKSGNQNLTNQPPLQKNASRTLPLFVHNQIPKKTMSHCSSNELISPVHLCYLRQNLTVD